VDLAQHFAKAPLPFSLTFEYVNAIIREANVFRSLFDKSQKFWLNKYTGRFAKAEGAGEFEWCVVM